MPRDWVITDDGCRPRLYRTGSGRRIVFCGGGPGLADYLGPLAGMFAESRHIVRWDQRGCGNSDDRRPYTVARSVEDLHAMLLATGSGPVTVLGHSWGATLALTYTVARPASVDALLYVSGTGIGTEWKAAWRTAMRDRLSPGDRARLSELDRRSLSPVEQREAAILRWTPDFADRALARVHAERLATPWHPINDEANRSINAEVDGWREATLATACGTTNVPTLIVHGEQDPRPVAATDSLYAALPDARRVVIDGAGHCPWVEHPQEFRRAVEEHLARTAPGG